MESISPRTDLPKRKRRWYHFSLRGLQTSVTLAALFCGLIVPLKQLPRLTAAGAIPPVD